MHAMSRHYKTFCVNEYHVVMDQSDDRNRLSNIIGSEQNREGDIFYYYAWLEFSSRYFFCSPLFYLVLGSKYLLLRLNSERIVHKDIPTVKSKLGIFALWKIPSGQSCKL